MLDTETKRRIDTARDILVGKVPDPKSQVEQITIALIYKFMDDMDKESIEFGGNASFFSGEYAKYRWSNIFDPRLGGYEMLNLYSEAILKLNINPNIPQLFRDIFKNAYLPYRDPETLKLFLKTINEFTYDHSERLGDAFEYLLSVLSSQGDAGQFRTPRHIIDFIVEVLDPKKNETVLDPACGTAGFLISSYKHIVEQNTKPNPNPGQNGKSRGDMLTPSDKKSMMQNFAGYDISPDMVRLSLVNMYLHNFTTPKIYEYDTLTSEDRWGEYFDIIMANPPFMSPKGGIKPHRKFTMQANRSEVLFVDYIAEHINPISGRSGVIVPEGIIFQSGNAYKSLRKLLVEKNFLYAVVSLPAGIFQPYSGVKTSILFMDKTIAKKTDKILFIKAENDGYSLGAQRKEIEKNDLTAALDILKIWKKYCQNLNTKTTSEPLIKDDFTDSIDFKTIQNQSNQTNQVQSKVLTVSKDVIAKNGDFNLSIDRYRINDDLRKMKYEMVELGKIFKLSSGKGLTQQNMKQGNYAVYGGNGINGYHNEYFIEDPIIVIGRVGAYCGVVHITESKCWVSDNGLYVTEYLKEVNQKFVAQMIIQLCLNKYAKVGGQPSISQSTIYELQIPLPPLSVQQEIVTKIENYQKIIDGAKQIVTNYKPQIDIDPDWEMVELGDVCEKIIDGTHQTPDYTDSGEIFLSSKNVITHIIDWNNVKYVSKMDYEFNNKRTKPQVNDILLAKNGVNSGHAAIVDKNENFCIYVSLALLRPITSIINPNYLLRIINTENTLLQFQSRFKGVGVPNLHLGEIKKVAVPLPPLEIQQEIVSRIENEQQLVNASKELIKIFEQKIKDEINKLWE